MKKNSTLHVYWFLRLFPPSTLRLLQLCTSFPQKIPPSTFFQPLLLLIQELLHPLHVALLTRIQLPLDTNSIKVAISIIRYKTERISKTKIQHWSPKLANEHQTWLTMKKTVFSDFSCKFLNPNYFSNLNSNCSKIWEQVLFLKLYWPFIV